MVTDEFAPRLLSSEAGDVDEKRDWPCNTDDPASWRLMPTPGETVQSV
jgi:hypothetical protein